ncbi:TetR/AcrR family transcriptional regulator [Planotetraspora kaengkrachanensis]|uniref:TetR family transcriptional regulator n=1 Tax=Planotetraspora kaengkrachanensis TaxID=575193 RepID=A0A8J3V5X5_9ACTN|nr:TetR/AcrR family transcriptional regulator [Planotetraspora kaengkrachanensis]GIG81310.1 TetR family transcriptional regulator [Planotetraspora kaengkrachanensis]
MPRAGLSPAAVVDAALTIVDEQGPEALTLSAVATRTGVATPSLYKHVRNLEELRTLIARRVMEEMTELVGAAVMGRSGPDAVTALMRVWRRYAVDHPARYAAMPPAPLQHPALEESGRRLMEVVLAVLRGCGLEGEAVLHSARCLRAAVHGFAALEVAGGFGLPEDLDTTYRLMEQTIIDGLLPAN